MSKIVMLLTNAFEPDVRVYKESKYLLDKGHEVTILCWDREPSRGFPEKEVIDGIKVVRFAISSVAGSGMKQLPAFVKYINRCKKYLKENTTDYLHCNDIDGAIAGFLARQNKTTMVFDMHEYYEDYEPKTWLSSRAYRILTKFLIKRSKYALYENNLYLKQEYKNVRDKLLPLRNFPDSNLIKCLPKTKSDIFRIGYHGAVRGQIPEFTTLFEATKDMKDVHIDVHGGGPDLEELKKLEKKYEHVTIHGPFNGTKELTNLYANSDIVFAGYMKRSKSCECDEMVKFFECITTATPMILTECYTLMAKQINSNGYGITCDTQDIEQVKKAVHKFKNDKAFLEECAENERKNAKCFDWNEEVKVLDRVYE